MLDRRIKQVISIRLRSAGIIEVMIAMLIICVVMICSSILYARLLDGNKGILRIKAEMAAIEIYNSTLHDQSFTSDEGIIHDIAYTKEISQAPDVTGLYKITIKLHTEDDSLIYQFDALTRIPE